MNKAETILSALDLLVEELGAMSIDDAGEILLAYVKRHDIQTVASAMLFGHLQKTLEKVNQLKRVEFNVTRS